MLPATDRLPSQKPSNQVRIELRRGFKVLSNRGTSGLNRLVNQVVKFSTLVLESSCVDVREVVRDDVQIKLLGNHSGCRGINDLNMAAFHTCHILCLVKASHPAQPVMVPCELASI